ncbi:MAG: fused response regulator/phosphatase [Phycisphaerae bacterium]|nr:fused response regulator/phosphatase [Phycisphaerae bacterium]
MIDKAFENEKADILVVDDDPIMRAAVRSMLRRDGYNVLIAESGLEALGVITRCPVDLVLLDCMMAEMTGFEMCKILRQDPEFGDIPVIFLTAKETSKDKAEGFATGGSDYLVKPVDYVELLARVKLHVELSQSRQLLQLKKQMLDEIIASQKNRLNEVRDGQETLLADPKNFPDVNVAVQYVPAHEAGGDFYDIVRMSENDYGFFMADVSGHDLGTAYITGCLKALTASFVNEAMSVMDTMIMMNISLGRFLDPGKYVTASYVKFSKNRMEIEIIGAGHPEPILQSANGDVSEIKVIGDILGIHETIQCDTKKIKVNPGDRLFIYTDGLSEGYPGPEGVSGNRSFGVRCLKEQVNQKISLPINEVVDDIISDLIDKCNGSIGDDVVLMGIEF